MLGVSRFATPSATSLTRHDNLRWSLIRLRGPPILDFQICILPDPPRLLSARTFCAAKLQHSGARRIRDFKAIYHVSSAVQQRVKRNIVKRAVRYDYQPGSFDQRLEWLAKIIS